MTQESINYKWMSFNYQSLNCNSRWRQDIAHQLILDSACDTHISADDISPQSDSGTGNDNGEATGFRVWTDVILTFCICDTQVNRGAR
jgi:hypothetical protein